MFQILGACVSPVENGEPYEYFDTRNKQVPFEGSVYHSTSIHEDLPLSEEERSSIDSFANSLQVSQLHVQQASDECANATDSEDTAKAEALVSLLECPDT